MNDDIFSAFGGIFGDIFSTGDPSYYAETLDEHWANCKVAKYYELLNKVKNQGFKVLRNSDGRHKVVRN